MPAPAEAVFAKKAIFDYRSGEDFGTAANCGEVSSLSPCALSRFRTNR